MGAGSTAPSEAWYVASKPGVTFAFCVVAGVVTKVAPIGRRWMKGRAFDGELGAKLHRNGYDVRRLA